MWNGELKALLQRVHRDDLARIEPYSPGQGAHEFTIPAYKVTTGDGTTHVGGASDQDWAHCSKKLAASLDSSSRVLRLGPPGLATITTSVA